MTAPGDCGALIDAMLHAVWLVDEATLRIVAANQAAQGSAPPLLSDSFVRRFDGSTAPVTRRIGRIELGGRSLYAVALQDRSEHKRIEHELEVAVAELAATLESTTDGILVTDLVGRIRNFNRRFAELWGVPEDLLTQRNDDAVLDWMRRSVTEPTPYMRRLAVLEEATLLQASDVLRLHSGRVIERSTLPQCSRSRPIGRVFSFRNITERVQASERIEKFSHVDALTGESR